MIPYYEELNDEEKNAVTKVIRTLLKQTFVLERKYDKKSGRLVYNKEFRTIDLHQEFLREYFKISGIELRENLHLGVFYIEGETLIGEKISRLSTIYLLILKLLYDEHMAEASSNTSVYTSLGEIHEKINDFHLMKTLPSITEMRRSIALLKNPRPSVFAYKTICIASITVDFPLPECPVKKLIPSLKLNIF